MLIVTMVLGLELHGERPFWNGLLRSCAGGKSREAACSLLCPAAPSHDARPGQQAQTRCRKDLPAGFQQSFAPELGSCKVLTQQ